MLLFKGPVRGACCALPRHGFRSFVSGFCYNFRLLAIFYAGFLTFPADSTNYGTFLSFLSYLYCICSLIFFVFFVFLYRIVIVITDCSSLVKFFATMCYHALLYNHLCNVMSSFIL